MNRAVIFETVKRLRGGQPFTQAEVILLDRAIDAAVGFPVQQGRKITAKVAMELICHEAIVQEAYKDSVGVWTWSVGLTNAAGINVQAYKDNPQSLKVCLAAYIDRLTAKYLPGVLQAFRGVVLTDEQLAAALSFHYNTGAIATASWVQSFLAGNYDIARQEIMNWRTPREIIGRRTKERNLFFDGAWCSDGKATVYPVKKPSYAPDWAGAKKVDVRPIIEELLS